MRMDISDTLAQHVVGNDVPLSGEGVLKDLGVSAARLGPVTASSTMTSAVIHESQPLKAGNWMNLLQDHFHNNSFKPNLLGFKHIQLQASTISETDLSEEGLLLWKENFAKKPQGEHKIFSVSIPVSWFNFIVHLLMTPDKFGWTVHMLKSDLWQFLTKSSKAEQSILFHIPDKCSASQAPVCKLAGLDAQETNKENAGDSSNQQEDAALLLPFGAENTRKRRGGKTPLVETEVRRSGRIQKDNDGFKRGSCSDNTIPPVTQKNVVKNLSASFCKVAETKLEEKLSKKPKRKEGDGLTKVPLAKDKEHCSTSSK